jgi:hypothetical protein
MALFLIPLVSATDTYQQNKAFNYNKACTVDGAFCDSSFTCNLTLETPNKKVIINNKMMSMNGSFYNFSIGPQASMGIYNKIMNCENGTAAGTNTEPIEITGDGLPFRTFPITYVIIIIAFLFLTFNTYLNKKFKTEGFTIFGSSLLLIAGIITLYPGYNYTNWSTLEGLAIGMILIGLGGIILTGQVEDIL